MPTEKSKLDIKKIALTTAPLMLVTGSALAAASGVPMVDQSLNTIGRIAEASGYAMGAAGCLGLVHHVRTGSWMGAAESVGLAGIGGSVIYNYPTIAGSFGGAPAATLHMVYSNCPEWTILTAFSLFATMFVVPWSVGSVKLIRKFILRK